jgi:hypothetical protein
MARIAILDRADMNAEQARLRRSQAIQRHRGRAVLCLYPIAEIVRGLPNPAGLSVIRTIVAPRATDCESCRRATLECSISVVRAGSTLARRGH